MRKPELLAPAGNREAFEAAIAAGADAVYLGAGSLNARRNAANFDGAGLEQACRDAHLHGRAVYLTANTLVFPGEEDEALSLVAAAAEAGIDAAIVQDVGLAQALRRELPELELHTSTQMNIRDEAGIRFAQRLGFTRVTLARELSAARIAQLASLGTDVECFVHGALCICRSGQCLFSSLVGGRSANRGLCAQPCRLPYTLVDEDGADCAAAAGAYLLSPKDLCGLDLLPALVETGVASLKIEGRMKSAEYVCTVTAVYRQALDRLWRCLQRDARAAAEHAARGACASEPGPLSGAASEPAGEGPAPYWHDGPLFAAHSVPAGEGDVPRALPFDDVPDAFEAYPEEHACLCEAFSRGFTTGYLAGRPGEELMGCTRPNNRGVFVGRVSSVHDGRVRVEGTRRLLGGDVLPFAHGDVLEFYTSAGRVTHRLDTSCDRALADAAVLRMDERIGTGDRVFRVQSGELAQRVERRLGEGWDVPVNMHVTFPAIGEPMCLCVDAASGPSVRVEGPAVERARTKPLASDEAIAHIQHLGNTPYRACAVGCSLPEGDEVGCSFSTLHRLSAAGIEALERALLADESAWRRRPAHAAAAALEPPEAPAGAASAGAVRRAPFACALDFSRAGAGENVARSLAEFEPGMALAPKLYATNVDALATWAALGASFAWLSPELTLAQIATLAAESPLPVGLIVAGRAELMESDHCFLTAEGRCSHDCATCARRAGSRRYLLDRKGYRMPVTSDEHGHGHIYNAVPLDAVHVVGELLEAGVTGFAIDTTLMDGREAARELSRLERALAGERIAKRPDTTTGHLFRQVR